MSIEELKAMRQRLGFAQWKVARALNRTQTWLSIRECGYQPAKPCELEQIRESIERLSNHREQRT